MDDSTLLTIGILMMATGATLLGLFVYLLPVVIAGTRSHPNTLAIAAVVVFFGWTFIGWALAMVWALTDPTSNRVVIINEHSRR